MRNISKKQSAKNAQIAKIKKELLEKHGYMCMICRKEKGTDLMHILPKSLFPEHYTANWNLIIGCRSCHEIFDSSASFRRKTGLYERVKNYEPQGAWRYFQMNNSDNDIQKRVS